ncbi:hypothetical protein RR46_01388 [Papilio xuthus]|uniref:Uncharacterized protein n=1 Tax=Papilio xuthus TaxID=66420 RepID=A0A0N1PDY4_PAPXU|nr:hypothetical protein RR46_01388 [Papilio xuthus]
MDKDKCNANCERGKLRPFCFADGTTACERAVYKHVRAATRASSLLVSAPDSGGGMRAALLVVCAIAAALAVPCPPASQLLAPATNTAARAPRPLPMLLPRRRQFLMRAPQRHAYDDRHYYDLLYEFNVFADDYGAG